MFVSINMDDLQFVHKHEDHETVSALAWLEMPHKSVTVENTDREYFLCKATALDMRILYRNTTGEDITGTDHIVVREMLATLVDEKLKPTWARREEVLAQIDAVADDLEAGIPWNYAVGARKPAKQEDLFRSHCSPLSGEEAIEAATRAPQRRKVLAAPTAAPKPPPALQPPPTAKQRMPSVRPVIWEVADTMWREAGSPTDKAVVLELRKKMMAYLESEKGIKKTSSSNELGNWMKNRVA